MVKYMYYLNYFFIFSILGHLLEVLLNGKSGILFGFWTPVYGFGAIIILLINLFLEQKLKLKGFKKAIFLFLISSILLAIIEALGGYLIEWIFNKTFWNYSDYKFNIGKYTALEMSLVWGIGSIIFIYLLKPLIDKKINNIPKFFSYSLSILFIIDVFLTIIFKH